MASDLPAWAREQADELLGLGWGKELQGVRATLSRDIAQTLVAAEARGIERQWRPIETAPEDGTEILVSRERHQGVSWFNSRTSHWVLGPGCYFDRPTHWMPLTSPPAAIRKLQENGNGPGGAG